MGRKACPRESGERAIQAMEDSINSPHTKEHGHSAPPTPTPPHQGTLRNSGVVIRYCGL
jgi:hypothetical protein